MSSSLQMELPGGGMERWWHAVAVVAMSSGSGSSVQVIEFGGWNKTDLAANAVMTMCKLMF